MTIPLDAPGLLLDEYRWGSLISKPGLNHDQTLDLDYFVANREQQSSEEPERFCVIFKRCCWRFVISPLCLGSIMFTLLCLPKQWINMRPSRAVSSLRPRALLKRGMDIIGALFAIITCLPIFAILPLVIRLDSDGLAIYKQTRIGRERRREQRRRASFSVGSERRNGDRRRTNLMGQPFQIYKFRSMRKNAEQTNGAIWAVQNDPRVTKIGRFLRPYHLDEVPQFVNVLRGEMSLVGPRPERPEHIVRLKEAIPNYGKRLVCKPGLTGLAQISCGYDSCVRDVEKKLRYDLYYMMHRSLSMDVRIVLKTLISLCSTRAQNQNRRTIDELEIKRAEAYHAKHV